MCVTGVWRDMGALPYLNLIECKLNLVSSFEWKAKNEPKWPTTYLDAVSVKKIISGEYVPSELSALGVSQRRFFHFASNIKSTKVDL